MEIKKTKTLDKNQYEQINRLWNLTYPAKLADRFPKLLEDVEDYNHYLIEKEDQIVAWAVEFNKDNERRFSIIVAPNHQNQGLGKTLIDRLKLDLKVFYGWVIDHNEDLKLNGAKYISPLNFYIKLGCEVLNKERINNDIIRAVKIKLTL